MPRSIYSRLHRTFGSIPSLAERQAATQNKVAAVAETYPFQLLSVSAAQQKSAGKSVIVVGAGFAGLTAA